MATASGLPYPLPNRRKNCPIPLVVEAVLAEAYEERINDAPGLLEQEHSPVELKARMADQSRPRMHSDSRQIRTKLGTRPSMVTLDFSTKRPKPLPVGVSGKIAIVARLIRAA